MGTGDQRYQGDMYVPAAEHLSAVERKHKHTCVTMGVVLHPFNVPKVLKQVLLFVMCIDGQCTGATVRMRRMAGAGGT